MKSRYASVAVVSCVMLLLELDFTRVLSFIYWNHLVYLIVSVVLLGYGAGAMFVILARSWMERFGFDRLQGVLLAGFAVSAPVALIIVGNVLVPMQGDRLSLLELSLPLLLNYLFFVLPFFFLGAFIVRCFFAMPERSGRLYLFDLAGASAGCALFPFCLKFLGAPRLALLCAAGALALSFVFIMSSRPKDGGGRMFALNGGLPLLLCVGAAALIGAAFFSPDRLINIRPVSTKILAKSYSYAGAEIEYTRWDVGARIDVASADNPQAITGKGFPIPNLPHKVLTNDGDAYTAIVDKDYYSLGAPCEKVFRFLQSSPYLLHPPRKALIIGVGGGPDIIKALACNVGEITGVEVAGATVEAMEGPFADYSGGIYLKPNVKALHDEGRSFLRRSREKYNIIQMSGVDTFSALASGAYVLAENYLYTVDAMKDFVGHLENDGFIVIRRWYFRERPRETLRLFVIAYQALREIGVDDPGRHIIVSGKFMWATTVIKKNPYTRREMDAFRSENASTPELATLFMAGDDYCAKKDANFFYGYACAFSRGHEDSFMDDYYYDISPVYDNNPFFFKYYKAKNMFGISKYRPRWRHGYWAYWILGLVLLQASILVVVFIFLPLFVFRKKGLKLAGSPLLIGYFACLGLGFIIMEIALMQQLTLFLGLPVYSIAVTLSGLLLSAGLGSMASERFRARPVAALAVVTACFAPVLLTADYGLPLLIRGFLGSPLVARVALSIAAVFPMGFLAGFYFPTGLVVSSRVDESLVPWAWGINAGFTVIGSILAIIAAMAVGFRGVIWFAIVMYVLAFVCMARFISKHRPAAA